MQQYFPPLTEDVLETLQSAGPERDGGHYFSSKLIMHALFPFRGSTIAAINPIYFQDEDSGNI